MSFRDRLLCLLDEHEQLEKQYGILLEKLQNDFIEAADDTILGEYEQLETSHHSSVVAIDPCVDAQSSSGKHRNLNSREALHGKHEFSASEQKGEWAFDISFDGLYNPEGVLDIDALCSNHQLITAGLQHRQTAIQGQVERRSRFTYFMGEKTNTFESESPQGFRKSGEARVTRSDVLSKMRRMARLQRIFEVTESIEQEEESKKLLLEEKSRMSFHKRVEDVATHKLELFIDTWISAFILANALFIGLQMDHDKENKFGPWQAADCFIASVFVFEVCLKCWIHGIRPHFCGQDKYLNCLDLFLIFLDVLQLLLSLAGFKATLGRARIPSASLFRVIRLLRVIRLIRLLRTQKFRDLASMVQGMVTGSTTLCWAILLFGMMLYVIALLGRSAFGFNGVQQFEPYFGNVGESMYTVYRCSFGDCPIAAHIYSEFGWVYALAYAGISFVIMVGLFNVISAIFVEGILAAASKSALAEANSRLNDENRWATNVTCIIRQLLMAMNLEDALPLHRLSNALNDLVKVEFTRGLVEMVIATNTAVQEALDALDIDVYDHQRLSDILDPDHGGTIDVLDLMNGLQRLRGQARRSDVVTVDLMVRKLQERVDDMRNRLLIH